MARIRRLVTRIVVVAGLAVGGLPRAITLLELLRAPSVARVVITRRRIPDYAALFAPEDQGDQAHPAHARDERDYRWADTA